MCPTFEKFDDHYFNIIRGWILQYFLAIFPYPLQIQNPNRLCLGELAVGSEFLSRYCEMSCCCMGFLASNASLSCLCAASMHPSGTGRTLTMPRGAHV
jgi:hypothetical protein